MITGRQIREARFLLRWSHSDLARRSNIALSVVKRSDATDGEPLITIAQAAKIEAVLKAAGIHFANDGEPIVLMVEDPPR